MSLLAAAGPSPLWYLTRGTGLVALVLLTATVVLGVLTSSRWHSPTWPRFVSLGLHRNLSLLTVAFLALHILTAELDTFAPVGWLAVVVPFGSVYRPLWLGLGTVAFDLLLALVVTSLMRTRLGFRTWRAVHWLAYLSWPVALVHGLGTGTDARLGWVQLLDVLCVLAVLGAVVWRLARTPHSEWRLAGGAAATLALVGIASWAFTGPLKPGWAKRAGTPTNLLASSRSAGGAATGGGGTAAAGDGSTGAAGGSPSAAAGSGLPALPFGAAIAGTLNQTGPDASGEVTITVDTHVSGSMTGSLIVTLRGRSSGDGVALSSSEVTFGPTAEPSDYRGRVAILNGNQLVAEVRDSAGSRMDLGLLLQIDPSTGTLTGTLQAGPAYSSFGSSPGDGESGADR